MKNSNSYQYFSFFEMKAIEALPKEEYPFVKVEVENNQVKRVIFNVNSDNRIEVLLNYENGQCYSKYTYSSQGSEFEVYNIYNVDTIQSFTFQKVNDNEPHFIIREYSCEIKNGERVSKKTNYYSEPIETTSFEVSRINHYVKKCFNATPDVIWEYNYQLFDEQIRLERTHKYGIDGEIILHENICAKINGNNYCWLDYVYFDFYSCE